MVEKYTLGIADYVVIVLAQLVVLAIGLMFRCTGNKQNSTNEFLMAGRNMGRLPIILSITVTLLSTATMLGNPAEVYNYGITQIFFVLAMSIGISISALVFVPVFFQCGVSTSYEFLELRFGKPIRYLMSAIFIVQMVLYMGLSLYGPSLALNSVTEISIEASILLFGSVCVFYCTLGGLKAVLWSDVFQGFLMGLTIVIIFVSSISEAGGIRNFPIPCFPIEY